jgi:hypothetical protein
MVWVGERDCMIFGRGKIFWWALGRRYILLCADQARISASKPCTIFPGEALYCKKMVV